MSDLRALTDYVCHPLFGLTTTEAKLLRWSMQGILYRPDQVPSDLAGDLAQGVRDVLDSFRDMQRDFGEDPADPTPPADRDYEYTDLVEKLAAMDAGVARHLYFVMVGYLTVWDHDDE